MGVIEPRLWRRTHRGCATVVLRGAQAPGSFSSHRIRPSGDGQAVELELPGWVNGFLRSAGMVGADQPTPLIWIIVAVPCGLLTGKLSESHRQSLTIDDPAADSLQRLV